MTDINALSGLSNLESLLLENNNIRDVSALRGLASLESLYLTGNPLAREQIDALKAALPDCAITFETE